MPIQNAEELFITVLSNVRSREERSMNVWQEMSQAAQHDEVRKVLDTRTFLTRESISNIDECFRLLGKQPIQQTSTRVHDVFVEDFRKELTEIQNPGLKGLFVLHKAREYVQMHMAAYVGLIAMADMMGNYPVSALLETNLASKMVFIERTKGLLHEIGSQVIQKRMLKAA